MVVSRQKDRKIKRQKNRKTERQKDREADRHTGEQTKSRSYRGAPLLKTNLQAAKI